MQDNNVDPSASRALRAPRSFTLLGAWSLGLACLAVAACGGSSGGGSGAANDPNRGGGQAVGQGGTGKPAGTPAGTPGPVIMPRDLVLESHRLGETVVVPINSQEPALPNEKQRVRCEAVYQLAFPDSSASRNANPFRLLRGKASWAEALSESSGAPDARVTALRTLKAEVRIDGRKSTTLQCAFPVRASALGAGVKAFAPKGAARGLDEKGDVYGGFRTQVLGGLRWQRRLQPSPIAQDSISLQWLLLPEARASDHGFFRLETESLFARAGTGSSGGTGGACVARAYQLGSDAGFERASLWGISDLSDCGGQQKIFALVDKAPSGDAPVARLADGRIDPWSVMAYDDRDVVRADSLLPFDPSGAQNFSCETPFDASQCGQSVARDMASVLSETVGKGAPVFVRFASVTLAGRVLLATGSISPEGKVEILDSRIAAPDEAIARVLP
jgi:hypothetical protein